jgi:hypothetical protein
MSAEEAAQFLEQERTVVCATNGVHGRPHLMPLWYVLRAPDDASPGPQVWAWTYAASQKVRNLERDARATLQVEAGESYEQLRGLMLETDAIIHREPDAVAALGAEIFARYTVAGGGSPVTVLPVEMLEMIHRQAAKRVGLQFVERRRSSWDHRKLGGVY